MQRLNGLTFRQLRALEAVAETGSITRAADILNLTPPAVHTQLKTLEENFNCLMFDRRNSEGFQLTSEGDALLRAQRQSYQALAMAVREIDALRNGLAGAVVLGVVSTGKYFAPQLVAEIKRAHPDIEVMLKVGNRDQIIAALQENAVDMAMALWTGDLVSHSRNLDRRDRVEQFAKVKVFGELVNLVKQSVY